MSEATGRLILCIFVVVIYTPVIIYLRWLYREQGRRIKTMEERFKKTLEEIAAGGGAKQS